MSSTALSFEAWEVPAGPKSPPKPSKALPCQFSPPRPIEAVVASAPETAGLYKIYDPRGKLLSRGQTLTLRRRLQSHMRAAERLCGKGATASTGLQASTCSTPGATKADLLAWEAAIIKGVGDKRELERAVEAAEYLYELVQEMAEPTR